METNAFGKNAKHDQPYPEQYQSPFEDLMRHAFMAISCGILIADCLQEGCPVVYVNQAFTEMTGHQPAGVLGKSFPSLPGMVSDRKELEPIRDAVRAGSRCMSILPLHSEDGVTRYGEISVIPLRNETGTVNHYLAVLKDVTAQVATEESLIKLVEEKESRIATYFDNAREGIWRCDLNPPLSLDEPESEQVHEVFRNAAYVEANDAMARLFGFAKGEELIGRSVGELMPMSDPKNVQEITQLVRQKFHRENWLTYEKTIDGSTVICLNNVTPCIRDGKLFHACGSSLDVTGLFEAQERLKRSEDELVRQKQILEKKNIALKELIEHIELEKKDFKERITANLEHVILPSLNKIRFGNGENALVEQHRRALEDLASSFGRKVTDERVNLTPREIEVCNMVKTGLTNKDISRFLHIALHTVEKHRRTARKKLGLANKGINLRTYLNSL